VSSFSGRQQLYERYYSGDPVRLAGALYAMYEKDSHVERIHRMLDELEARQARARIAPVCRLPLRKAGAAPGGAWRASSSSSIRWMRSTWLSFSYIA